MCSVRQSPPGVRSLIPPLAAIWATRIMLGVCAGPYPSAGFRRESPPGRMLPTHLEPDSPAGTHHRLALQHSLGRELSMHPILNLGAPPYPERVRSDAGLITPPGMYG